MKQLVSFIQIMAIVAMALLVVPGAQGQENTESKAQELDTRVWSQSYWLEMAKLGLVEVAPPAPCEEAVYTSSRINVPGILTKDSPDIAVTTDPNTTQSENSVFIHPLDVDILLNSNNSTDWNGSTVSLLYGADALFTTDGGATWGGQIQGAGGTNNGDPAAVIGRNGWYYVGYIAADGGQGVAYSVNQGNTWTHVQVASGGWILDKNHLWIDNCLTSPHEGNLYSAWTNFQGGVNDDEIELSRSTDDGSSWLPAVNISSAVSAGSHDQGVNIQTGPNGEVYAVWAIYDSWPSDECALGFAKSTDGGATFAAATRIITGIRGIRITETSKDMRVNSFPVMAVDISGGPNDGHIYVLWTNIGVPGINVGPDIDVYMIKSTDGGSSWSAPPVKVNQDPAGLGKEHFFPWITCDPVSGALSAIFYDDRNVASTDCEVFVAISGCSGDTWSDFKISDVSFTPSPIPGLASGYFGDYLGISARAGRVYPCWTDNRPGRAMTYVSPFVWEHSPIQRGLEWLRTVQNANGSWAHGDGMGTGDVGPTALAAVAFINDGVDPMDGTDVVKPALDWILTHQNPDGSFGTGYEVYKTALANWALGAAMIMTNDLIEPLAWGTAVTEGRDYLLNAQWLSVASTDWRYGGIGYAAGERPDLSNHQMALLGLRAAELALTWNLPAANKDPAITFTKRCQNHNILNPGFVPPTYIPADAGGFKYMPYDPGSGWNIWGGGHSYGSITGGGLWALHCCGLSSADPAVIAGKDWIFAQNDYYRRNPGIIGDPDRFYYYHAMTAMKAFTMLWQSKVVDGHNWYEDFLHELINRQNPEGSWRGPSLGWTTEYKVWATAQAITAIETWATVLTGQARWDLSSEADLIVYDPDGNRCWIDYEAGVLECNIPGAVCSGPHPSVITINAPQAGGYTTQVVGREYGWYRLTTSSHLNGTTVSSETHWGWTHEGEIDEWSTVIATVFHPMTLDTDFPPVYPPEPSTVLIPNTEECVNPGDHVCLPILLDNNTTPFGGFELEVEFDYTSMTFVGAEPGELIEGFEKFTYRLLPCPACGCCKYKILLYGQYDMPNGVENIGDPIPLTPIREYATLVNLCFVVNNDENLRGLKIPVCWEWEGTVVNDTLVEDWECGENTFSSWSGDTLYTSSLLCQFNPEICDDPTDRIQPILIFQQGICGQNCGGVDICPAGPGECKRGDINMNTLTYEVADAVLFASYFVEGTSVFRYDEAYQICATDVNADGRTLTLSDLVYLIRVILHDAVEIPKLTPSSEVANVIVSGGTISTECAAPIGAILFEFDSAVNPTLLADMEMVNKDNKVLVWSSKGKSFSTSQVLTFEGEAELITVTAVDRDSRELTTTITGKVAPPTFALHLAYPNPFNPFTNLSFTLPENVDYSLKIYNVAGQLVKSYEDMGSVGLNRITWDSKDNTGVEVASGVYFYKLTAGGFSATEKMVILK